jgi:hypothetical protein
MSKVNKLIDALALCLPQFNPLPMLENPPANADDQYQVLHWMYDHLKDQGLMEYVEWKEYFGELPELSPLADMDFSAFNDEFVMDTLIDMAEGKEDEDEGGFLMQETPYLEYMNSFLINHGLRLIDLLPFENAYILCVKNDLAALEQLENALSAFKMSIDMRDALDEAGIRARLESLVARE